MIWLTGRLLCVTLVCPGQNDLLQSQRPRSQAEFPHSATCQG